MPLVDCCTCAVRQAYKIDEYLLSNEPDEIDVHLLLKELAEKVACSLLPALDAYLTELTYAQSEFLGINAAGLFMPEWHRSIGFLLTAGATDQAPFEYLRSSFSDGIGFEHSPSLD